MPLDIRDAAQQTEEDQWHVSLFQVRYTTQKCNGIFARISKAAPRFWHAWFSIGAVVGVLVMAVGLFVIGYAALKIVNDLVHALIASARTTRHVKRAIQTENDEQVFLPMVITRYPAIDMDFCFNSVKRFPGSRCRYHILATTSLHC